MTISPLNGFDTVGTDWRTLGLKPLDFIRPDGWRPSVNALDFGHRLARSFIAAGYPREASTAFLLDFMRLPVPRRISFWIEPLASEKIMVDLNRRLERLQSTAYSAQARGRIVDAHTPLAFQDAMALRDRLAAQETKMFEFSFLVTLLQDGMGPHAQQALLDAGRRFLREAQSTLWEFRPTWFEQGAAFLSSMPLGEPSIQRRRMLDSDSIACTFAITSADVMEPGGVTFGMNRLTHNPVILNLADTRLYPAPHMVVIAQTRSGKSMLIKYYLLQRRMMDPALDVVVLDPSKPIDYQRVSEAMGTYVRLRPGSRQRLNVCEIAYPANLAGLDVEDRKLVSKKIDYLRTLLYLMAHPQDLKGAWSDEERPLIEPILRSVYEARGMTDDPVSLIDPATLNDPVPRLKPMPILADIQQAFLSHPNPAARRIGGLLEPWITGTMNVFNGQTTIHAQGGVPGRPPLDQPWITFNIDGLIANHDELQHVVHFIIGEIIAQRMVQSLRKKIVVLDEAHVLFGNPDTALWASRLYRMAAKVNTQVILITQSLGDMIGLPTTPVAGAEYARICLKSSYVTILMRQTSKEELGLLAREFNLQPSHTGFLNQAQQGQALLITHRFRAMTYVPIPPVIRELITSNPDEIGELEDHEAPYLDPLGGRIPIPHHMEVSG